MQYSSTPVGWGESSQAVPSTSAAEQPLDSASDLSQTAAGAAATMPTGKQAAVTGQAPQGSAQAASTQGNSVELSDQPSGISGIPARTMTLSENADLENVNPAVPVGKREDAPKNASPFGQHSSAAAASEVPSRALTKQPVSGTGTKSAGEN